MTNSQFTALAELLRLRENSAARHAAMLVLVDGMSQADAARKAGTGPQNVNRVVKTCLRGVEMALAVAAPIPARPQAECEAPPALVQAPKKPKIGAEQERLIQAARTKLANYKGMSAEEREAYEWYRDRLMPVRIQVLSDTLDEDELSSEEKEEVLTWRYDFRDMFRDGREAEWLKTQE